MNKDIKFSDLICPDCKSGLNQKESSLVCQKCNKEFKIIDDKLRFVEVNEDGVVDFIDKIKYIIKRFDRFYYFLINLISPVCPVNTGRKFINQSSRENSVFLNLGSGNSNLSEKLINIDLFPYKNVDITCDIEKIPFNNNTVDKIINIAVLEHLPNPEKVISEIYRILKPSGEILCFFPFIQGFHASPYDYSRRTIEGMKILFKDFDIVELKPAGGPTSGFLWILQEWLSILFSFGLKPLYLLWSVIFMFLTFPLKFLDLILIHHPMAKNISSGFSIIAKKKKNIVF